MRSRFSTMVRPTDGRSEAPSTAPERGLSSGSRSMSGPPDRRRSSRCRETRPRRRNGQAGSWESVKATYPRPEDPTAPAFRFAAASTGNRPRRTAFRWHATCSLEGKRCPSFARKGAPTMRARLVVLVLIVLMVGVVAIAIVHRRRGEGSLLDTLRSVKETSEDAATTSKVKTALLLSKHVSAFDIKVNTSRGEVTLRGEVPSEE